MTSLILEKIVNQSSYLKKNCHSFISLFVAHPPVIYSSPTCHITINTLSCVNYIHQPLTHFPHTTFHSTFHSNSYVNHSSLGISWNNLVFWMIILLLQFCLTRLLLFFFCCKSLWSDYCLEIFIHLLVFGKPLLSTQL